MENYGNIYIYIYIYILDMYIIKGSNNATAKPVHEPQSGQKGERARERQVKLAFMCLAGLPWLETDEVIGGS